MKERRQYENRVKINAVIIYLLASMLCVGMIYYIITIKQSINFQKDNIEKNEKLLSLTNKLIKTVNEAQSYANLYIFDGDNNHLNNYKESIRSINSLNDSIIEQHSDSLSQILLNEITTLLESKEQIIKEISNQYNTFNPYQEIYNLIDNYKPHRSNNSKIVTTIQDTIIYKTEKKNFFKRLGEVFSPDKSLDSLVLVSKTVIDSINEEIEISTEELLSNLELYTEKGRKEYLKQIVIVENRYKNLIFSDQEISKEISDLLIVLHRQTLDSVLNEIQKSENIIDKSINLSILIAIIALLVILTFIFLIFNDVKKVIEARRDTETAKKRAEDIMESRHKLLLSVSHDVKAPLSSILGYLELMQMDIDNAEDQRKIKSMKNSAEHILSLLSNLLNFSRLDQGKESPNLSDFSIGALCDDLSEMFKPIAENKHLSFIYKKDLDNHIFIKSDPLKIKQILSNVLSNATKYTIKGSIIFNAKIIDNKLIFNIIDEGIGIPKDKIEDIFTPFNRIENKGSIIEGSGFGLFVVKGLIDLLDGKLEVNSEINKGTQFIISIPIEFVDHIEESNENTDIQIIKTDKDINILIIDDDNSLLAVIESMLSKLGIKSQICHSSFEFESYCKVLDKFDIVLTDREMGAFSGLEVLNYVKSIDSEKKVYLMTARSEYNESVAESKGFDGYLPKPFSIKNLGELLKCDFSYETSKDSKCIFSDDFADLCAMFDNDENSIRNILKVFVESTSNNLVIFNEIIDKNSFKDAVNLCHKMYPMFIQLGQMDSAAFLSKMDKLRGLDETSFIEWKEESLRFMNNTDEFISYLSDKYEIE